MITLIRLSWLPLVLLLGAQVAIGQALARSAGGTTEALLEAGPYASLAFWSSAVLQTIALSVVAVRTHRLALFGDTQPGSYFGFPFGRTETLYVAMVVLFVGGIFGLMFSSLLLLDVIRNGLGFVGIDVQLPRNDLVNYAFVTFFAVGLFAGLWFATRMALWAPAVVANDALSLGTTWRMTRGYAAQMFWLFFFTSQVIIFGVFLTGLFLDEPEGVSRFLDSLLERHSLLGGWVNPSVHAFAMPLSAEKLAIDLGLTFFFTTFMAALLSFTYLTVKAQREAATPDEAVEAAPAYASD